MNTTLFTDSYGKLNKAQREAVDTTEGPVMVVAGPGTGKTQVLALRIANILQKTDAGAESVLCLTFTNSGVRAMRERLERYIGNDANRVSISTFHSFAIGLIEKHYDLLDFAHPPELLSDEEAIVLVDSILENNEWEHIRPRANPTMYFNDLKHLISLLKRERISAEEFLAEVKKEINTLESDPDNISSRGETKGSLKKEIEKKIESLKRTEEVVVFYKLYEKEKRAQNVMDYDDALEYAVLLAEQYEDVRADIRENYLYILVDEHQDSSGVQNSFLKAVWGDVEKPNIFVVGDDRQLIYAFSGASLSYFEEFANCFGKAKCITLSDNYRSTEAILSLADDLLQSTMASGTLVSHTKGNEKSIRAEYSYPRDEVIGAGLYFKRQIQNGVDPSQCALLVPRNYHVREAIDIFSSLGLPVSSGNNVSLFSARETMMLRRVLGIIADPFDSRLITESVLDQTSGIPVLLGHTFLHAMKRTDITLADLVSAGNSEGLFADTNPVSLWGVKLSKWVDSLSSESVPLIVATIGNELLVDTSSDTDELLARVEIVRSFIHLAMLYTERNRTPSVKGFLEYLNRMELYGAHIVRATFGKDSGVRVMTLHKSKGLEYERVWIAHMNEEVMMSEKKTGFALPEKIKEHIRARDVEMAKRELYVAITRAKKQCIISYANEGYTGNELSLAEIIRELPDTHFVIRSQEETEKEIIDEDIKLFTKFAKKEKEYDDVVDLVKQHYSDTKVSVTLLNNFFECPRKWYFRNFLQLPEVKGVSLSLGSAVHSVIEYILKSPTMPSEKIIDTEIAGALMREGVSDEKELKRLSRDAMRAVGGWVKKYYPHLAKDRISERSLSFKDESFPHLLMYGKIDLTERFPDRSVMVTDFKTGLSKTSGVIEKRDDEGRLSSYMRQLAMYSYLVAGSEKGTRVAQSRLLFLEADVKDKNALYETSITDEEIDLLKRDISDYDRLLSSGEWVTRECHAKIFGGGNTECEYCARATTLGIENKG